MNLCICRSKGRERREEKKEEEKEPHPDLKVKRTTKVHPGTIYPHFHSTPFSLSFPKFAILSIDSFNFYDAKGKASSCFSHFFITQNKASEA